MIRAISLSSYVLFLHKNNLNRRFDLGGPLLELKRTCYPNDLGKLRQSGNLDESAEETPYLRYFLQPFLKSIIEKIHFKLEIRLELSFLSSF